MKIDDKNIRSPKQTRSIETKNKILKTSVKLFCEKGFYKTTTNEIAKTAQIPIGSVYAYFKNKKMILLEILNEYNDYFLENSQSVTEKLSCVNEDGISVDKLKALIKNLIEMLIKIHSETRELNVLFESLSTTVPEVNEMVIKQHKNIENYIYNELKKGEHLYKIKDFEATEIVLYELITSVVHRVFLRNSSIDNDRIINACVDAIYKFLC